VKVTVRIMSALSTGGTVELEFPDGEAPSVARVLDALGVQHPHLAYRLLDADGALQPYVNVFVGRENVNQCDGLATPVSAEAEVWIVPPGGGG
jgi:molybdopterin converting factor small subunit